MFWEERRGGVLGEVFFREGRGCFLGVVFWIQCGFKGVGCRVQFWFGRRKRPVM